MEMGRGFSFVATSSILLPTKEQLKAEIEKQKAIFYAQHPESDQH